ncbi:MAG TPA: hypothetical protein DEA08_24040 [Planctomycetes bacterium]|nr:hypothetical protein [Planctomycetota bacterium]|tara:strand:- start:315 stop:830 length:516 start_codon:yes stop_codon:yes gene_type:complete
MAFDAYLSIPPSNTGGPPPKGESQSQQYPGAIEIESFDFGIKNQVTIGSKSGGAGAGKVEFKEFSVTKAIDSATASFFHACCHGAHFPKATLALVRQGAARGPTPAFMIYEFEQLYVVDQEWDGNTGDDVPRETVSFKAASIKLKYSQMDHTGTTSGTFEAGWSFVSNRPV